MYLRKKSMRENVPAHARLVPEHAECVFKGVVFDVYHWQQEMFDGSLQTFEMLKRPDTVKVIAIQDDQVLIIKQEQPHLKCFYDIPGGLTDVAGENERQAAMREFKEETGYAAGSWRLLDVRQPAVKIDWLVYTFLAWDLKRVAKQQLDAGERIEVLWMSIPEIKKLAAEHPNDIRYLPMEIFAPMQSAQKLVQFARHDQSNRRAR